MSSSFYQYSVKDAAGNDFSMESLRDKVVLVVNTASRCGFTSQYAGLQSLYERFRDRGFVVIGFPCNQFMHQEPGSMEEIASFCSINFGVTFPLMSKVDVNGDKAEPLFTFLKKHATGLITDAIKWNFTKFLINRQGDVVARYAPNIEPEKIAPEIEKLLSPY